MSKVGDEKLAEIRCTESGWKKEVREKVNVMGGDCDKTCERVGGE